MQAQSIYMYVVQEAYAVYLGRKATILAVKD